MQKILLILFALALTSLNATPARACSVSCGENGEYCDNSAFAQRKWARQTLKNADAIIDGEVVQPFIRGRQNAIVRAHRVFKGPDQEFFEVGATTSCDQALVAMGERLRLILFLRPSEEEMREKYPRLLGQMFAGEPGVHYASITTTAPDAIDDLLDSDRSEDWPYFPGESAPAEPPRDGGP